MPQKVTWTQKKEDLYIKVNGHFDFNHCLKFLNRNPAECLHRVTTTQFWKVLPLTEQPVLIAAGAHPKGLLVKTLDGSLSPDKASEVIRYVIELFDLTRDLDPFYKQMEADPSLNRVVRSLRGLRLIGIPDLFEALCWSVIGQQINLNFAYNLKRRLVESTGSSLSWNGERYWTFPSPETVLQISDEDFKNWQFSRGKYVYIKGIAEAFVTGTLSKNSLVQMSMEDAYESLLSLKGIGPWSAHYVLMKCLGYSEAYPIQDVGLHNALKYQLNRDEKPSLSELEDLGKRWHPWQGYVTFYLWHTLIT